MSTPARHIARLSPLRLLRRFLRREDGSVLVEGLLILPMLLWAAFGLYVYWDAYKSINQVQKTTFTVADAFSRLQVNADVTYANGMETLMAFLLPGDEQPRLRFTSVMWVAARNRFEVQWSCSLDQAALPRLTTTAVQAQAYIDKMPTTANADTLLLVESEVDFTPVFDVGINDLTIRQFVATRPRFVTAVNFNNPGGCT